MELFGYGDYLNSLEKLFKKKSLPNCLLVSGVKGIGKTTLIYHFINRILSLNENHSYDINKFKINSENVSYNLINKKIHPNFYQVDYDPLEKNIKIDQIRNLIKFTNKTTYLDNLKIILIDNAENLNLNSSNALLKSIEEPNKNTFFFLIYNTNKKILNTIKSRCLEFKISFSLDKKIEILKNLINQYSFDLNLSDLNDYIYCESPGNLLRYINLLRKNNLNLNSNTLENINFLVKVCEKDKSFDSLNILSFIVEKHYTELSYKNFNNFLFYNNKRLSLTYKLNELKDFNLNIKNTLNIITDSLIDEKR